MAGRLSGLWRGGAMAGEAELRRARCLADSEHQKRSQGHGEIEERTAISPRGSVWPEKEEKRPGAHRGKVQGR